MKLEKQEKNKPNVSRTNNKNRVEKIAESVGKQ